MISIGITGYNGFVGKSILEKFEQRYQFDCYKKYQPFEIIQDVIIHLAGKSHDLRNILDASEYYTVNTELTKKIFDAFLLSDAKIFITLSSVKAVADTLESVLTENHPPNAITHYGKSKLLAEQYILSKSIPEGKRVYILRPCMIHGPGNKGNLNLLYQLVSKGIPWPLGAFENQRSFCSIENLCFVINEIINNINIPSGVYNLADNYPISTNRLIELIAISQNKKAIVYKIPKRLIVSIAKLGDYIKFPLNSERLQKLTESYVVCNKKIVSAVGKPLPVSGEDGILQTLKSFKK